MDEYRNFGSEGVFLQLLLFRIPPRFCAHPASRQTYAGPSGALQFYYSVTKTIFVSEIGYKKGRR